MTQTSRLILLFLYFIYKKGSIILLIFIILATKIINMQRKMLPN